jgi:hypothetical protein
VSSVCNVRYAMFACALRAAVDLLACAYAMTNDAACAVIAGGRQIMDGALETVVGKTLPSSDHFK